MPFIYSTLACPQKFTEFRSQKEFNTPVRSVNIKGGHGIADKHGVTKIGVFTEISTEDLEFLKKDKTFLNFVDKKFLVISTTKKDPEKVIASQDMEFRDGSAPKTPEILAEEGAKLRDDAAGDPDQPKGKLRGKK